MINMRIVLAEKRKEDYIEGKILSKYSITPEASDTDPTRLHAPLNLFKETTLAALQVDKLISKENTQIVILPLIGRIQVQNHKSNHSADAGEVLILSVKKEEECTISNNYEHSEVHYVVAGFSSSDEGVESATEFSLVTDKLSTLFESTSNTGLMKASIGQYAGRSEDTYHTSGTKTFVWILQGAFEVENCLLQKADGLALTNCEKLAFEALSNDAIMILLEMI